MGIKVANNAFGTLAASLSDVATTLSVNAGEGARFPTLGAGDYYFLTLIDTANNIEIVKVTARSSDSMTIVRGQDGTTAKSYAVNDRVELRPTAALFDTKADVGADVNVSQITGVLPISKGGTNNGSLITTAGGVLYTDGSQVVNVGAGTSGQLLQSNGSSAPSWATIDSSIFTLLGTITASGNSVSLTGLNLTPYKQLYIVINGVSTNSAAQYGYLTFNNTNTAGADVIYTGNIAHFNWYHMYLDLTTGFVTFADQSRATLQTLASGSSRSASTGIINSSTAIYFRMGSTAAFDAGTILVYGVK
jgi:hypothetical protein